MDQQNKREHSDVLEYSSTLHAPGKPWKRSMARSSVVLGGLSWVALSAVIIGAANNIGVVMMGAGLMFIGTNLAAGCGAVSSLLQEPEYRPQAITGLVCAALPWAVLAIVTLAI